MEIAETEDDARAVITALAAASFPACFSPAFSAELDEPEFTNVSTTTARLPAPAVAGWPPERLAGRSVPVH